MPQKKRYLTKSRFKIGAECPTKLFYTGKPQYGNNKIDNAFLEALAEGGFQVGALAHCYHPSGTEVIEMDSDKAVADTDKLLTSDKVTLFEAAIRYQDLLVRVDILTKTGKTIELIEVKAKSIDPSEENFFYNKTSLKRGKPQINSEWEPYLLDIAFQTYVAQKAFPNSRIRSHLMLADKTAVASVDGLNQRFFLDTDKNGRTKVAIKDGTTKDVLGKELLVTINVDEEVELLFKGEYEGKTFEQLVAELSSSYVSDKKIAPSIGQHCKNCEFRIPNNAKTDKIKSGFEECWTKSTGLSEKELSQPLIFDVWNFRRSAQLVNKGVYLQKDIEEEDVSPTSKDEPGWSQTERQWLQISKTKSTDTKPEMDFDGLAEAFSKFKFPLHFIDFETTMAAIPFNKGRHPYEQIAFQFSHHMIHKNGTIEHKTEYINRERGVFPNFEFVRNLKAALENDNGTIFRYAAHENTVLCQIYNQLVSSKEKDREELCSWIRSITTSTEDSIQAWDGNRTMIDMCELVKKFYYNPLTNGSNSIKKVLPAILKQSDFIQGLYSKPVYGNEKFKSHNYKNWVWLQKKDGEIVDPYKLLPPVFDGLDANQLDQMLTEGSIADGGAAMTAYARMQFTEMSEQERELITSALLKYCELDTFAMVIIYQYWKHELQKTHVRAA